MIINKFISIILATVVLKKHSNKLKQKRRTLLWNKDKLSFLIVSTSTSCIIHVHWRPWRCSNNNCPHLTWMWSRRYIYSICSTLHYMYFTKYILTCFGCSLRYWTKDHLNSKWWIFTPLTVSSCSDKA